MARPVSAADALGAARAEMAGPFRWGTADCASAALAAFARLTGLDLMGEVRGSYDSALGAARILRGAGGYLPWMAGRAAAAGLRPRRGTPAPGDLALLPCRRLGFGAVLALSLGGGRYAGKGDPGLMILERAPMEVWACPGCRA